MSNNKHHPFSPSRLELFRSCPGAYLMQQGMEEEDNEYSAEGRMLHERVASGDLAGLKSEQADAVTACLNFRAGLLAPGLEIQHEVPLAIKNAKGEIVTEGTADDVINHPGEDMVEVTDWKFGWIPVKAAGENIQLASYAVGAMRKFGKQRCRVHVFQPRIRHKSSYVFTEPDKIIAYMENIIATAKQTNEMRLKAGSHCRYCLARLSCPTFRVAFQKLPASRGDYNLSNPKHLEELYGASRPMKDFIKEIEEATKKFIIENGRCGMYVIETKDGSRKLGDASSVYDRVKDWITPREFNGVCNIGLGKFETLCVEKIIAELKARGEDITKEEAKRKLYVVIGDLISRDKPTQSIVVAAGA